jgi:hypothetical protein
MGLMSVDEVTQGPQAPPRRPWPRWVWVVGGVALVVVGALLVVRSGPMLPAGDARPPASVRPSPSTQVPLVAVGVPDVCPGFVSGRVLTLSFTLQNVSSVPMTIGEVTPSYPLGQMGATLAVRFRLALPPECPAPYPVAARVVLQVGDQTVEKDTPVYADLGGIAFPNCRAG